MKTSNEGHMVGKLMQFTDGGSGDVSHERYCIVEIVEIEDGFIELAFDSFSPKRRNYIRIRMSDYQRAIREYKGGE